MAVIEYLCILIHCYRCSEFSIKASVSCSMIPSTDRVHVHVFPPPIIISGAKI
jgi:hypothetical protein